MSSSFEISMYLSTKYHYYFSYPIDTNIQNDRLRDELRISEEEFKGWKPNWEKVPMFDRKDFLESLSNDFVYIHESHPCREIVVSKGTFYNNWYVCMGMLYRSSYTTLTYPEQIPAPFKETVTSALLKPYAVNVPSQTTICNLDHTKFGLGLTPGSWNKAWISLLTYFAKYGEFMVERAGVSGQLDLHQTIRAILDSWSGQVGLYTAFGLWLWANEDQNAIYGYYERFNGIHNAMDHYAALYKPDSLLKFIRQYELDLDRVSKLYLDNHLERCKSQDFSIPSWYLNGCENDDYLVESPEWNDYMGYTDEDDEDYDEDYDEEYDGDDDDWDFGEDW